MTKTRKTKARRPGNLKTNDYDGEAVEYAGGRRGVRLYVNDVDDVVDLDCLIDWLTRARAWVAEGGE